MDELREKFGGSENKFQITKIYTPDLLDHQIAMYARYRSNQEPFRCQVSFDKTKVMAMEISNALLADGLWD